MKELTPLYTEEIHMLDGQEDEEVDQYLEENPWLIPLFEIGVIEAANMYIKPTMAEDNVCEPDREATMELRRAQEAFDCEMEVSRRVTDSALEEINIGTTTTLNH